MLKTDLYLCVEPLLPLCLLMLCFISALVDELAEHGLSSCRKSLTSHLPLCWWPVPGGPDLPADEGPHGSATLPNVAAPLSCRCPSWTDRTRPCRPYGSCSSSRVPAPSLATTALTLFTRTSSASCAVTWMTSLWRDAAWMQNCRTCRAQ